MDQFVIEKTKIKLSHFKHFIIRENKLHLSRSKLSTYNPRRKAKAAAREAMLKHKGNILPELIHKNVHNVLHCF